MGDIVRLGDHVDVLTGYPFKSSGYVTDGGIRLLRGDNIGQGRVRWDAAKLWPIDASAQLDEYALNPGDVVLAMDRPWIEAGLKYAELRATDTPSVLVQRVARLRAKRRLDQRFLACVIASHQFESYVRGVQTGTAVPHISGRQIMDYAFTLPPLWEQRAIACLLGALDDKIAVNERIAPTTETMSIALASKASRTCFTTPLSTLVHHRHRQVAVDSLDNDVVAHYSLPAFDSGKMPEIVPPGTIKSGKFLFDRPSVLLSKLNPSTPRVWNVDPDNHVPALASSEFLVLEPVDNVTSAEVWTVCMQPDVISQAAGRATGTSNSHQRVRPAEILGTEVVDPRVFTRRTREQINWFASRSRSARHESRTLAQLRDTLLPKLMSGEIRVKDAEKAVEEAT